MKKNTRKIVEMYSFALILLVIELLDDYRVIDS